MKPFLGPWKQFSFKLVIYLYFLLNYDLRVRAPYWLGSRPTWVAAGVGGHDPKSWGTAFLLRFIFARFEPGHRDPVWVTTHSGVAAGVVGRDPKSWATAFLFVCLFVFTPSILRRN